MPRRRSRGSNGPSWLSEFIESDWAGQCALERFRAWRAAQQADAPDLPAASAAARSARRALVHSETCPVHPLPEVRPTGWNRGSEKTLFMLIGPGDSSSTEEVGNDSPRDHELRQAFEQWLQWLR